MRVAYASHSLVADRQAWFADALQDTDFVSHVAQVYPSSWAHHDRAGGYRVKHEGNLAYATFEDQALEDLSEFDPDVLLIQNEPYSAIAGQLLTWAEEHAARTVLFTWENQRTPDGAHKEALERADCVVYGNQDAKQLALDAGVRTPCRILPQVGIDANVFAPSASIETEYYVGFFGRSDDPMKNYQALEDATDQLSTSLLNFDDEPFIPYEDLPEWYNKCRLVSVPSRDVPDHPREQFAPAVSIEALLCGVPLVVSTQDAIRYWLHDRWEVPCPATFYCEENDTESLRKQLARVLSFDDDTLDAIGHEGRSWAKAHFSNEQVAYQYGVLFQQLLADELEPLEPRNPDGIIIND